MNLYQRATAWFGGTRVLAWLGRHVLTPYDRYARGRRLPDSTFGQPFPLVYLTTIGRHSGQPHTVPLLAIDGDDDGTVVAGSNFGGGAHPAWAYNLEANPRAVLEAGGTEAAVVARPLRGDEFEQYWKRLVAMWSGYQVYRNRTDRDVPMFLLEQVDPD